MKKVRQILAIFLSVVMIVGVALPTVLATQSRTSYFNKSYSYSSNPEDYIMNIAQAQIGRTQSQMGYTEAWCADFVGDCAILAGQDAAIPLYGGCNGLITRVLNAGGKKVSNRQKGDLIFYYCSACGCYVHVGLVLDSTYSIEGNYNNKVTKVSGSYSDGSHNTSSGTITKVYVRPNYKSGSHYHSYDTFVYYYEAHPHYNCYKCSCGDIKVFENETNYVSSCSECNHTHSYNEKYEETHPHRQYMECSCGSYYYTGRTIFLEENECCKNADSNWTFSDYDLPSISNLSTGSDYNIKGTISSNITINWVGIIIYNDEDEEITQANAYPGTTSYNISDLNEQLDFSTLPTGKYKILVHANNPNDDYKWLYYECFNVGAPILDAPEVSIKTTSAGKAVFSWAAVSNADCYDIRIYNSSKESYKDIWSVSDTSYEIELPDGDYYVWICAGNSNFYYCYTYGRFMEFSIKKTIPEKPELKNFKSEYNENDSIKFEWDPTDRTTHYSLYLKKINEVTNEYEIYDYEMHYVESGYERVLPAGKYCVQLQSCNSYDWSYTDGDWVEFTVYKNHIVTYDANGGSNAPAAQEKIHDVNLTLSTIKPTRTGYTFIGWNTKADSSGTSYASGASYTENADTTLYAQWKANTYTVTFNANGGSCSTSSKIVTFASTYGTLPTPIRNGYTFNGWYTTTNGGTKVTSSSNVSITANQTLYAQWTEIVLTSITVKSLPVTTSYYVGDTLDTSGLTLTATYNNGTTQTFNSGFSCTPTTLNTVGTQTITVTYSGKTTSFNVTVNTDVVKSVAVKSNPTKTSYYVGDKLNTSGLTLTATYNSGKTETVNSGFVCSPTTLNTAGTQTITVTYSGKTATFDVDVKNVAISSIAVKSDPTKTSYYVGDTLDTSGLTLTATYNNGTTQTIDSGFTCTPTTLNTAGTQTITVTYSGKTALFDVNVKNVAISNIAVKSNPTKTSYYVGDTLDTSGLTLTATYNNGTTQTINSGFSCTPKTLNTAGTQKITVSFGGKTTSFNVVVMKVAISDISIISVPATLSYYVGDTLSTEGLAVLVTYNNGTNKTVTSGFTCTPMVLNTEGIQKVTVIYEGKTASFNVSVTSVKITELEIVNVPEQTSYKIGEKFDPTGLTMKAVNNRGEEIVVTEDFVCSPEILDKAGTQVVTISYGGKSVMITVIVEEVSPETYTVRFISNSEILLQAKYGVGETIVKPSNPTKDGYRFIGWTPEVPDIMPAYDLTFTAVFEKIETPIENEIKVSIRNPSTTTINYGDAIILHADIDGTLPEGARIEWTADNGNFDMSVSEDGLICKISPKSSGKTVFTATVYDKDGSIISSDTQEMNAKAGLWQKIVAFFKKIFGLTKTIPEAFKGIF